MSLGDGARAVLTDSNDLFVTMSDDVGIGYPIFSVLFPPALYKLLFLLSSLRMSAGGVPGSE